MAAEAAACDRHAIDVDEWTREQVDLLRSRCWDAVDLEHLVEELEDMGDPRREALATASCSRRGPSPFSAMATSKALRASAPTP